MTFTRQNGIYRHYNDQNDLYTNNWDFLDTLNLSKLKSNNDQNRLKDLSSKIMKYSELPLNNPNRLQKLYSLSQFIIQSTNKSSKKLASQVLKNKDEIEKLKKDIQKMKDRPPGVKCPICLNSYKSIDYLDSHINKQHPNFIDFWKTLRAPQSQELTLQPTLAATTTATPVENITAILDVFKTEIQRNQQENESKMLDLFNQKISTFEKNIDEKMDSLRADTLAQTVPNHGSLCEAPFDNNNNNNQSSQNSYIPSANNRNAKNWHISTYSRNRFGPIRKAPKNINSSNTSKQSNNPSFFEFSPSPSDSEDKNSNSKMNDDYYSSEFSSKNQKNKFNEDSMGLNIPYVNSSGSRNSQISQPSDVQNQSKPNQNKQNDQNSQLQRRHRHYHQINNQNVNNTNKNNNNGDKLTPDNNNNQKKKIELVFQQSTEIYNNNDEIVNISNNKNEGVEINIDLSQSDSQSSSKNTKYNIKKGNEKETKNPLMISGNVSINKKQNEKSKTKQNEDQKAKQNENTQIEKPSLQISYKSVLHEKPLLEQNNENKKSDNSFHNETNNKSKINSSINDDDIFQSPQMISNSNIEKTKDRNIDFSDNSSNISNSFEAKDNSVEKARKMVSRLLNVGSATESETSESIRKNNQKNSNKTRNVKEDEKQKENQKDRIKKTKNKQKYNNDSSESEDIKYNNRNRRHNSASRSKKISKNDFYSPSSSIESSETSDRHFHHRRSKSLKRDRRRRRGHHYNDYYDNYDYTDYDESDYYQSSRRSHRQSRNSNNQTGRRSQNHSERKQPQSFNRHTKSPIKREAINFSSDSYSSDDNRNKNTNKNKLVISSNEQSNLKTQIKPTSLQISEELSKLDQIKEKFKPKLKICNLIIPADQPFMLSESSDSQEESSSPFQTPVIHQKSSRSPVVTPSSRRSISNHSHSKPNKKENQNESISSQNNTSNENSSFITKTKPNSMLLEKSPKINSISSEGSMLSYEQHSFDENEVENKNESSNNQQNEKLLSTNSYEYYYSSSSDIDKLIYSSDTYRKKRSESSKRNSRSGDSLINSTQPSPASFISPIRNSPNSPTQKFREVANKAKNQLNNTIQLSSKTQKTKDFSLFDGLSDDSSFERDSKERKMLYLQKKSETNVKQTKPKTNNNEKDTERLPHSPTRNTKQSRAVRPNKKTPPKNQVETNKSEKFNEAFDEQNQEISPINSEISSSLVFDPTPNKIPTSGKRKDPFDIIENQDSEVIESDNNSYNQIHSNNSKHQANPTKLKQKAPISPTNIPEQIKQQQQQQKKKVKKDQTQTQPQVQQKSQQPDKQKPKQIENQEKKNKLNDNEQLDEIPNNSYSDNEQISYMAKSPPHQFHVNASPRSKKKIAFNLYSDSSSYEKENVKIKSRNASKNKTKDASPTEKADSKLNVKPKETEPPKKENKIERLSNEESNSINNENVKEEEENNQSDNLIIDSGSPNLSNQSNNKATAKTDDLDDLLTSSSIMYSNGIMVEDNVQKPSMQPILKKNQNNKIASNSNQNTDENKIRSIETNENLKLDVNKSPNGNANPFILDNLNEEEEEEQEHISTNNENEKEIKFLLRDYTSDDDIPQKETNTNQPTQSTNENETSSSPALTTVIQSDKENEEAKSNENAFTLYSASDEETEKESKQVSTNQPIILALAEKEEYEEEEEEEEIETNKFNITNQTANENKKGKEDNNNAVKIENKVESFEDQVGSSNLFEISDNENVSNKETNVVRIENKEESIEEESQISEENQNENTVQQNDENIIEAEEEEIEFNEEESQQLPQENDKINNEEIKQNENSENKSKEENVKTELNEISEDKENNDTNIEGINKEDDAYHKEEEEIPEINEISKEENSQKEEIPEEKVVSKEENSQKEEIPKENVISKEGITKKEEKDIPENKFSEKEIAQKEKEEIQEENKFAEEEEIAKGEESYEDEAKDLVTHSRYEEESEFEYEIESTETIQSEKGKGAEIVIEVFNETCTDNDYVSYEYQNESSEKLQESNQKETESTSSIEQNKEIKNLDQPDQKETNQLETIKDETNQLKTIQEETNQLETIQEETTNQLETIQEETTNQLETIKEETTDQLETIKEEPKTKETKQDSLAISKTPKLTLLRASTLLGHSNTKEKEETIRHSEVNDKPDQQKEEKAEPSSLSQGNDTTTISNESEIKEEEETNEPQLLKQNDENDENEENRHIFAASDDLGSDEYMSSNSDEFHFESKEEEKKEKQADKVSQNNQQRTQIVHNFDGRNSQEEEDDEGPLMLTRCHSDNINLFQNDKDNQMIQISSSYIAVPNPQSLSSTDRFYLNPEDYQRQNQTNPELQQQQNIEQQNIQPLPKPNPQQQQEVKQQKQEVKQQQETKQQLSLGEMLPFPKPNQKRETKTISNEMIKETQSLKSLKQNLTQQISDENMESAPSMPTGSLQPFPKPQKQSRKSFQFSDNKQDVEINQIKNKEENDQQLNDDKKMESSSTSIMYDEESDKENMQIPLSATKSSDLSQSFKSNRFINSGQEIHLNNGTMKDMNSFGMQNQNPQMQLLQLQQQEQQQQMQLLQQQQKNQYQGQFGDVIEEYEYEEDENPSNYQQMQLQQQKGQIHRAGIPLNQINNQLQQQQQIGRFGSLLAPMNEEDDQFNEQLPSFQKNQMPTSGMGGLGRAGGFGMPYQQQQTGLGRFGQNNTKKLVPGLGPALQPMEEEKPASTQRIPELAPMNSGNNRGYFNSNMNEQNQAQHHPKGISKAAPFSKIQSEDNMRNKNGMNADEYNKESNGIPYMNSNNKFNANNLNQFNNNRFNGMNQFNNNNNQFNNVNQFNNNSNNQFNNVNQFNNNNQFNNVNQFNNNNQFNNGNKFNVNNNNSNQFNNMNQFNNNQFDNNNQFNNNMNHYNSNNQFNNQQRNQSKGGFTVSSGIGKSSNIKSGQSLLTPINQQNQEENIPLDQAYLGRISEESFEQQQPNQIPKINYGITDTKSFNQINPENSFNQQDAHSNTVSKIPRMQPISMQELEEIKQQLGQQQQQQQGTLNQNENQQQTFGSKLQRSQPINTNQTNNKSGFTVNSGIGKAVQIQQEIEPVETDSNLIQSQEEQEQPQPPVVHDKTKKLQRSKPLGSVEMPLQNMFEDDEELMQQINLINSMNDQNAENDPPVTNSIPFQAPFFQQQNGNSPFLGQGMNINNSSGSFGLNNNSSDFFNNNANNKPKSSGFSVVHANGGSKDGFQQQNGNNNMMGVQNAPATTKSGFTVTHGIQKSRK